MQTLQILASIASLVSLAIIASTAIVGLRQLNNNTKARYLDALLRIYDMIGSRDARDSRRFLYSELSGDPSAYSELEVRHVEDVCVTFDRVGRLVESQLVPTSALLSGHGDVIIRAWSRVAPYAKWLRATTGRSNYAAHFEKLANVALQYQMTNRPTDELKIVDFPGRA